MADIEPAELREQFSDDTAEWDHIRREGQIDMRYVAGQPWEQAQVDERRDAGRPCLAPDELGQYVNQCINDVRQNKRGIKVTPVGRGSNDQTAALRQGKIRDIEYRSNSQQTYTTMFENTIQRSYGFGRVKAKYVRERIRGVPEFSDFDQELRIEPVVNPEMVTPDPYAIRPDFTDGTRLFYHESWSKDDFTRRWSKASLDTSGLSAKVSSQWVNADRVLVAEYWRKELARQRKLLLLKPSQDGGAQHAIFEDQLDAAAKSGLAAARGLKTFSELVEKERPVDDYQVVQYLTNGLEILEKTNWPGQSIPWVSCYGKILYADLQGGGSKRHLLSLIRLARDPYMLYCYYRTCEAELIGMTPKFPYFVYKGQLSPTELLNLQKSLHQPIAVVQVEPLLDQTGNGVLPMPQRQPYEPPIQALEIGAEAARRAIQAAMGISPLPTEAQRHNQKSGVALDKIEESGQRGSFHFIDHYDEAITRFGQILDELIPHYYDTARDTSIRKPDDTAIMVRINDDTKKYSKDLKESPDGTALEPGEGDHDVTISVGPAMASERTASSAFADTIVTNPEIAQVVGPQKMQKLLAASIKLKGLGPIGDEMAAIIDPPQQDGNPAQTAQQLQALQQQLQQVTQAASEMAKKLETKQLENESRERIADKDNLTRLTIEREKLAAEATEHQKDRDAKLAIADINDKGQQRDLIAEERARLGDVGADATAHALDHAHERLMADKAHEQSLEAGEQGQAHALEQGEQAAALAPEPAEEAGV